MKKLLFVGCSIALGLIACQSNEKPVPAEEKVTISPTKIWETDTIMTTAESVLYDSKGNRLIVSLINGGPGEKDGIGGIAILNTDGKIINDKFTQGLNAPKGLALYQDKLYVSDIDQVVVINANSGEILNKIGIDTSKFLNDVAVNDQGVVYVSDSRTGTIYSITDGIASEYKTGFNNVNGLNIQGNELWVLAHNELKKVIGDSTHLIATFPIEAMDGIELVDAETFITSSWLGQIFLAKKDGTVTEVLDTRKEEKNTADIGYDPKNKIVYVPTFRGNTVAAYSIK